MYTKVMKWSYDHQDHYVFEDGQWVKLACHLGGNWDRCTAPQTFPRGTRFDYNGRLSADEADMLAQEA